MEGASYQAHAPPPPSSILDPGTEKENWEKKDHVKATFYVHLGKTVLPSNQNLRPSP